MKWLVPDWRQAHRWSSIWVAAFWGFFGGVLVLLPTVFSLIPSWGLGLLIIVMSITFAIARVTNQPGAD